MILYHFTSDLHIAAVKRQGLTRGVTVKRVHPSGMVELLRGTQWLTRNPTFEQSWNQFTTLPYRRTDNRITVGVPDSHRCNLVWWIEFSRALPLETVHALNSYGDPENWLIYLGEIPPEWFVAFEKNPCQSVKSVVEV